MLNRPLNAVSARLAIVAAALALLMLVAPVVFASSHVELEYEEGRTDPVETFSASDEDGDAIDWTLDGEDKGDFEIDEDASGNGVLTFKEVPNYESPVDGNLDNVYLVTVKASEASKLELEITVLDEDEPGKVTLSQPQPQVGRGLEATLDDKDADVADERWQWARGASADGPWADIDKATSASRSPVADDEGMYLRATVTYEDKFGEGKTASVVSESSVEERTTANAKPSFKGQDDKFDDPATDQEDNEGIQVNRDVDEGVKGANAGKPVTASDGDNDVLLYTIDSISFLTGSDGTAETQSTSDFSFSIGSRSGQLKTTAKLNSDDSGTTGADDNNGEPTYTVTVRATDPSGAYAAQPVMVMINDVNDAPTFGDEPSTGAQNRRTLTVVEGPDKELDADPAEGTGIDAPTYQAMDADAHDAGLDDDADANADPPIVALTYSVEGADKGAFDIGETDGALTFKGTHKVNYEAKDEYEITIVASDNSKPEGEGTVDVTVNVTPDEDDGVVTPTQLEPQIGKEVVASLEDEDGNVRGQSWQWYRFAADVEATDDSQFTDLDASADNADRGLCEATSDNLCRIDGATSPNYTPVDDDEGEKLTARVTYLDGHKTPVSDTDDDDAGDSAFVVTKGDVQEEDPANTAPKFSDDQDPNTAGKQADAERSVPENAESMNVGDPVTASDSDMLIYSLGGADAASFTIQSGLKKDDTAGQIKTAEKLDYETKDMYMVVVTATDPSGATDTINVNISVDDEDDKTVITVGTGEDEDAAELEYEEGRTDPVETFSASDEDGDAIDWTLDGEDKGDFEIDEDASGNGVLTFKEVPNYESPVDGNLDNVYLVTVKASEASKLELEITVLDEDEPGKVTLSQPQPQVGRGLEATLDDKDADVADERWQWARGASADGPWADIDKATSASRSPVADDEGMYLRATVTYEDKFGEGKTASVVSESSVEERTTANAKPSFKGQDDKFDDPATDQEDNEGIQVNRDVDEGVKGANAGKPVTASDGDNDVLLYTIDSISFLTGSDGTAETQSTSDFSFSIGSRSGQLKTTAKLNSDDSGTTGADDNNGEPTYTVTVRATDPSGAYAAQPVMVMINDVNDAPTFGDEPSTGAQNRRTLTVVEGPDKELDAGSC